MLLINLTIHTNKNNEPEVRRIQRIVVDTSKKDLLETLKKNFKVDSKYYNIHNTLSIEFKDKLVVLDIIEVKYKGYETLIKLIEEGRTWTQQLQ
jgi:hypothetical protein